MSSSVGSGSGFPDRAAAIFRLYDAALAQFFSLGGISFCQIFWVRSPAGSRYSLADNFFARIDSGYKSSSASRACTLVPLVHPVMILPQARCSTSRMFTDDGAA